MARIVPAKPKSKSDHVNANLRDLQDCISDQALLIQNQGSMHELLCLAPGRLPAIIVHLGAIESVDLDAREVVANETWDLDEVITSATSIAKKHSLSRAALVLLGTGEIQQTSLPRPEGFAEAIVTTSQEAIWQAMGVERADIGRDAIEDLLQSISPGATSYVPGEVTDAQKRWREAYTPSDSVPPNGVRAPTFGKVQA